eukprot:tig00001073_g6822.t1
MFADSWGVLAGDVLARRNITTSSSLPVLSASLFAPPRTGPTPNDVRGPAWSRQEQRKPNSKALQLARPATSDAILRQERRCPAEVLQKILPAQHAAVSAKETVWNTCELLRRANCFPHTRDASWLMRERGRRGTTLGDLEALVPPSKQKKKAKPRAEENPVLRKARNLRVEFDQIFSEDLVERELAILKITEYTRDQVVELREMIWRGFPELRGIFFTYARLELSVSQAKMLSDAPNIAGPNDMETISKLEFFRFCKDCKLFDNRFFTTSIAELLFMAVNRADQLGFEKYQQELARAGARHPSNAGGAGPAERRDSTPPSTSAPAGAPRRPSRGDGSAADREKRSEEADSEDVFTLSEFLSSLIRISFLKYTSKFPDLAMRLRHLLNHDVLPNARQENKDFFRRILIEPGVYEVVRSYRRVLFKVFQKYAAADATDTLLQGAAYNEKLNLKEFVRVFEDGELIGAGGLTLRQVRDAFALAQAELGDEVADLTGAGAESRVAVEVDDDSTQMDFNEFIEGVCRCADARAGMPSETEDDEGKMKMMVAAGIRSLMAALLRGLAIPDPHGEPPSPRRLAALPFAARAPLKGVATARRGPGPGATSRSGAARGGSLLSDDDDDDGGGGG